MRRSSGPAPGSFRSGVKRVAITLVALYAVVTAVMYLAADRLIFQPPPASPHVRSDALYLRSARGDRIAAAWLPNPRSHFTLLYSHGNGEDVDDDRALLEELRRRGFSVLAYDYPGYGHSSGPPSEAGAYAAADAAYDYAVHTLHVAPERLVVHGRSLGGAVAVDLASRRPVAGLILESTLTSASRVMFGFRPFVFERFNSIAKVRRIRCPVLVMHGTADRVIAPWNGQRLYDRIAAPKQALWVPGAGHNDVQAVGGERYWTTLLSFVAALPHVAPQPDP
jgi:fermentation-respiration switch protein FrsA (DUF1100 family)